MRLVGLGVAFAGVILTLVAIDWWYDFYAIEIREARMIFGAPFKLSDYDHCLYLITKPCDDLMRLSRLGGGNPYHPFIMWFANAAIVAGIAIFVQQVIRKPRV